MGGAGILNASGTHSVGTGERYISAQICGWLSVGDASKCFSMGEEALGTGAADALCLCDGDAFDHCL